MCLSSFRWHHLLCGAADSRPRSILLLVLLWQLLLCAGFSFFQSSVCTCMRVRLPVKSARIEVQTIKVIWQQSDVRKWMWAVFPRMRPFGCLTFSFHSMWSLFVYVRHTSGRKYGINVLPNANRHTLTQYQSYTLPWIRNGLNWKVSQ